MSDSLNSQVTDGVTQVSTHVLGNGASLATVNAYLGQAQAQAVLFANMVNQQQQQSITSLVATTRGVAQISGSNKRPKSTVSAQTTSMFQETYTEQPAPPEKPVVT